jgi:hypothetical protein
MGEMVDGVCGWGGYLSVSVGLCGWAAVCDFGAYELSFGLFLEGFGNLGLRQGVRCVSSSSVH